MKILLVGKYPVGTKERFEQGWKGLDIELLPVSAEEFPKQNDCDMIILRGPKMPKDVIARFAPRLKLIMRWGAGFDGVDVKAAREFGIDVCNTPGANAHAVAELAVGLMIDIGRKIMCHQADLKAGCINKYLNQSTTLHNKIVGIVGGGNIGRQTATRVQAFGAKTIYYDVFRLTPEMEEKFHLEFVDLDTLLKTAHIVSLHVPLTDDNHHMINAEVINNMRDGAMIINAARGGLMDDEAVLEAVSSGKLAGAGIDCPESEDIAMEQKLISNPNIIVTPHIGGGVGDVGDNIIPMIVDNAKALVAGESLKFVVNK